MFANYDRACTHPYIITDYSSGTEVCDSCGLVIRDQIFVSSLSSQILNVKQSNRQSYDTTVKNEILKHEQLFSDSRLQEAVDLLSEVCRKHNLSRLIYEQSVCLFKEKFNVVVKTRNEFKLHPLAANCLQEVCNQNGSPRSKGEISCMFQVAVREVSKQNSLINKELTSIDLLKPSNMLRRKGLGLDLDFSYKQFTLLGEFGDEIYNNSNTSPVTVTAYVLYKAAQHFDMEHCILRNQKPKYKLSMVNVAKFCSISPTCIKRLVKRRNAAQDVKKICGILCVETPSPSNQ